jgi:hypothetical protein
MTIQGRRGIYVWLMLLGFAVSLIILTGATSPELAMGILVAYLGIVFAGVAGDRLRSLRMPKPPSLIAATRATPAARKAAQRARTRPDYNTDHTLTDIGMIVNDRQRDGQWSRHLAQSVSMDDGAIQPYITIDVPPELSHRLALINFEVYDQAGRLQFTRQVEQWVRDGNNNVICDRQLPLHGNEELGRAGVWDLRVTMDGALIALHSFNVNPPAPERRRQFSGEGEAVSRLALSADDAPLSLEELLREQRERSDSQN